MTDKIFISYRRDNSKADTRSIFQHLERSFGAEQLFMDVDAIGVGQNFRDALDGALSQCKAMLVVIGRHWLDASGADGKPRLEDPNDFVNREIAVALGRGIPIVPVLVDGAQMPTAAQLPDSLKSLALMQATRVTHESFTSDMQRLERYLAGRVERRGRRRWLAVGAAVLVLAAAGGGLWWTQQRLPVAGALACSQGARTPTGVSAPVTLTFTNQTKSAVQVHWLDQTGQRQPYFTLAIGQSMLQPTFVGHFWLVTGAGNACLGVYKAETSSSISIR